MSGVRLVLLGAAGRMGRAIARLALADGAAGAVRLAGAVERAGHPDLGRDIGELSGAGRAAGVVVESDLEGVLRRASGADGGAEGWTVAVDFSHHTAAPGTSAAVARAGVAWLLGTTGLTPEEKRAADACAGSVPFIHAANMSLGVNLLAALVGQAARALKGQGYDVEVTETHHRRKADAPSGTALMLGRAAAEGYGWRLEDVQRDGRSGTPGPRTEQEIGFHAIRGGDVVGDHEVMFLAEGEMLTLGHRMTSRDTLAAGALRAARWLGAPGRTAGAYSMADVLGLGRGD